MDTSQIHFHWITMNHTSNIYSSDIYKDITEVYRNKARGSCFLRGLNLLRKIRHGPFANQYCDLENSQFTVKIFPCSFDFYFFIVRKAVRSTFSLGAFSIFLNCTFFSTFSYNTIGLLTGERVGLGETVEVGQKIQAFSYKISKSCACNLDRGNYS